MDLSQTETPVTTAEGAAPLSRTLHEGGSTKPGADLLARTAAVIVAGGAGTRFGRAGGKQLVDLRGRPLVAWSLRAFAEAGVGALVLVVPRAGAEEMRAVAEEQLACLAGNKPQLYVAFGGATRQDSVRSGISAVPSGLAYVAVHDGARPLITPEAIAAVVARAAEPDVAGAICAAPSVDTIKVVDATGVIQGTPPRATLWCAQTPQVFCVDSLRAAHERAMRDGFAGTDDASLLERLGRPVAVVDPGCENLKVTRPEDLFLAEAILRERGCA